MHKGKEIAGRFKIWVLFLIKLEFATDLGFLFRVLIALIRTIRTNTVPMALNDSSFIIHSGVLSGCSGALISIPNSSPIS